MADRRKHQNKDISETLNVSTSNIYRTKRRFVEDNLGETLNEVARIGMPRKLNANQEALLIALACSKLPEGLCRWTLNLIAKKFISLCDIEVVSTETIRRRFKKIT
jgi:transposase